MIRKSGMATNSGENETYSVGREETFTESVGADERSLLIGTETEVSTSKVGSKSGRDAHVCKYCNKTFQRIDYMRRHLSTHEESPYKCPICERGFASEGRLKVHDRTHSGEKPYECKECEKCFSQKGNLKIHMRKHTGEKPYECEHCSKQFTQLANLNAHVRIHTGERPYECPDCGASFRQLSSLLSHKKTHLYEARTPVRKTPQKLIVKIIKPITSVDEETGRCKIVFNCGDCGKSFRTRFALKRHSHSHTGVQVKTID